MYQTGLLMRKPSLKRLGNLLKVTWLLGGSQNSLPFQHPGFSPMKSCRIVSMQGREISVTRLSPSKVVPCPVVCAEDAVPCQQVN